MMISYRFREFSKEREKAASRGEYQKNKARSQMDTDMKVWPMTVCKYNSNFILVSKGKKYINYNLYQL